ncbi:MAG: SDR family NAD(P)-dependent oxidoreductase [Ignavibacteria bacterium]|nr:SDR family NAD(P)-dependent oxidoreductase [Ignavibacteria bacterium]MCC7158990.1 SDR family NAD(P)-dependent oxidoreductase [Ignavibacteria bacterium]
MNLTNKIAIVTGGTGALGRVIVNHLAAHGMKVYVPVRSMPEFMKTFDDSQSSIADFKSLPKRYGLPCDATNEADVKEFCDNVVKQEKRIDYLVNTVGGFHPKHMVADTDTALIEGQLKLNFYTTFFFTKYALSYFKINNFGRVVSIGAKPAIETTAEKFAYSFSKAGVVNLMQTLAEEHKEQDITFNAIIPSIIDTPANRESMQNQDFSKWVTPLEIAETCLILLEEGARSYRGNVIKMYGKV